MQMRAGTLKSEFVFVYDGEVSDEVIAALPNEPVSVEPGVTQVRAENLRTFSELLTFASLCDLFNCGPEADRRFVRGLRDALRERVG